MDKSPIPIGHFADIGQGQQIHYHAAGPADGEVVIFLRWAPHDCGRVNGVATVKNI